MSQPSSGDDASSLAPEPLPQEEFPNQQLSAVVEERADNTERCIFYPEDIDPSAAETHWLAVDAEFAVDVSECR
jgi:hypothetical protein